MTIFLKNSNSFQNWRADNPTCRAQGIVFFWSSAAFLVFDRKPLLHALSEPASEKNVLGNVRFCKVASCFTRASSVTLNNVFSMLALLFSQCVCSYIASYNSRVTGIGWSGKINESIYTLFFIEERQKVPAFVTDACSFTAAFILCGKNALAFNWKLKRVL